MLTVCLLDQHFGGAVAAGESISQGVGLLHVPVVCEGGMWVKKVKDYSCLHFKCNAMPSEK